MLDPSLCPSCFGPAETQATCPRCGYDTKRYTKTDVLTPGTSLAGRYVVGGLLGQGGFGATYRGFDERLASIVAIKEFFPVGCALRGTNGVSVSVSETNSGTYDFVRSKFLEEARTLAKLRSVPVVVSVFDFFEENNTAYIIMEFLSGTTLKALQLKEKEMRLPTKSFLPIILKVLSALSDIHECSILHRDVSPDNIMIDNRGNVKLLDFGAARQALSATDQRMTVILKPGYAPLEQYSEKSNHGPWSDLYAAAATFYALLTGTKPPASLDRLVNDDIKPLSDFGIDLPPHVCRAIMKALAVQPRDRWQTAANFAEELRSKPNDPISEGDTASGSSALLQGHCAELQRKAPTSSPPSGSPSVRFVRPPVVAAEPHSQLKPQTVVKVDGNVGQIISASELKKALGDHNRFLTGKQNGRRLNLSLKSLGGVKLGGINFTEAELTGTDFSSCNLAGSNFTGANLFCADLSGANLCKVMFIKCDLRGARFDDAHLSEASFHGADCREGIMLVQRKDGHLRNIKEQSVRRVASFVNAKMAKAILSNANLASAKFEKAILECANFDGANLQDADMAGTVLKNASFKNAKLLDCDFTEANLEGVDTNAVEFNGAKIVRRLEDIEETLQNKILDHKKWVDSLSHQGKRLVLTNGDLSGLQMVDVDWSAAELLSINMTDINLKQSKISMTDFSGSTLSGAILFAADARGAKFRECCIRDADFTGATLTPVVSGQGLRWCATFSKSDLRGSKFEASDCEGADFKGADLRKCSFRNASLRGANFTGAIIDGVDFTNCILDGAIGIQNVK